MTRALEDGTLGGIRATELGDVNVMTIAHPPNHLEIECMYNYMCASQSPWRVSLLHDMNDDATWMPPNVERIVVWADLELGTGLVQRWRPDRFKGRRVQLIHATVHNWLQVNKQPFGQQLYAQVVYDIRHLKNLGADELEIYDIDYRLFQEFAFVGNVIGCTVPGRLFKNAVAIAEKCAHKLDKAYINIDPLETHDAESYELMDWLEKRNGPFKPIIKKWSDRLVDFSAHLGV